MVTRLCTQFWSWVIVFYDDLLKASRSSEVCGARYCTNFKCEQVPCPGLDDVVDFRVQCVTQGFFAGGRTFQTHQAATKEDRTAGLHGFIHFSCLMEHDGTVRLLNDERIIQFGEKKHFLQPFGVIAVSCLCASLVLFVSFAGKSSLVRILTLESSINGRKCIFHKK